MEPGQSAGSLYSTPLLKAALDPGALTLGSLWRLLSTSERQRGLTAALSGRSPAWGRRYLAEELTRLLSGFRLNTVLSWDDSKLAAEAVKRRLDRPALVRSAIVALHLSERRHVQEAFFDLLGIPHQDGQATEELPEPVVDPARLAKAAERLLDAHPGDECLFYLLALTVVTPESWSGLRDWLHQFAARLGAGAPEQLALDVAVPAVTQRVPQHEARERTPEGEAPAGEPSIGVRAAEASEASLSVLDHQMTLAIVDGTSGITGALAADEIDDMLDELVRLNGRRHQTFYHVGFRDVMFGRPVAQSLPAENLTRWQWYLAGYIVGLERRKQSHAIVELFDRDERVRQLGSTGHGPSAVAAHHVFTCLCKAGRYAEAARFATERAAFNSDKLVRALLDEATSLLRREQPSLAEPMFDVLWRALARRKAELLEVSELDWNDVRRRRAHCLCYRDSSEAARPLLEEVLDDSDSNGKAAVLTDLGLIDAGYRRLFDLAHPANRADIGDIVTALTRGVPRFLEAIDLDVAASAHGRYVWGFLSLLKGDYQEALDHLDRALAEFEARPQVYSGGNLLIRARLHVAIAICHMASDVVRLPRVAHWIAEAIRAGERVPDYLIEDVLAALALADSAAATHAAEQILEATGPVVLDLVASSEVAHRSRAIVDALLVRARSTDTSVRRKADDWFTVVPLLLRQSRAAEAAEGLNVLEGFAHDGVAVDQFLQLLEDPDRYSPAWDVEDARWAAISCCEAAASYPGAVRLLEAEGHRVLASDRPTRFEDAADIVERVRGYGREWEPAIEGLQTRLDALVAREQARPEAKLSIGSVRVLVVGGNEVQGRYDAALVEELRVEYPEIDVEFLHTGWNSNWNGHLADVERRLDAIDAVVIMRLIRTELGRQIRARLGSIPWRCCTGRGKAAIRATIIEAATAASGSAGGSVVRGA